MQAVSKPISFLWLQTEKAKNHGIVDIEYMSFSLMFIRNYGGINHGRCRQDLKSQYFAAKSEIISLARRSDCQTE